MSATPAPATPASDDRLIVALDVPNALQGLALTEQLGDAVSFYKIGLGMLTGGGLALANELKQEHGKRIFLDMKLFDIGNTVENAVRGLAQFDLDFLTVHGDPHVVRAAKEGASGKDLKILAVTILTSLNRDDLDAGLIKAGDVQDLVIERAAKAFEAGADGVIASPQEAALIRALPQSEGRLIVTPGVRPAGAELGDQKRVATPANAVSDGADHIVVGRPIYRAEDPRAAAHAILAELNSAQATAPNRH
ncbi:orotidine-5'-phosphate decarboxylase [Tropicibacter sp. R16_0]|uniref:orotidine-5'-phosphate decarboxylase n=1 Tax=Tropicibacter sp. R16_0 TaxID=2821102 RepID=UPI001ADCB2AC|nr:orotidine-5'-phosphate decarboxylase [Tropicibacter sp. R16_0]MBO9450710.1 orotidine-5'-phosphate decarboxylase [Tropicibacter sp. R16_0]